MGDATVPESGRSVEEGSAMSPTLPTTLQSRLSGMGRVMVPASNGDRKIHRIGSVSRSPRVPARRVGHPPLTAITVSCCGPDFVSFVTPGTLTRRPPYRSSCLTTPAGFIPLRRFGLLATLEPSKCTWHPKISMMPVGDIRKQRFLRYEGVPTGTTGVPTIIFQMPPTGITDTTA